jgi:glycosyltransferase involved in cell wall biosynthesis
LKIDNAVLLLAGNGKHQDEIKSLTEKLGIAEKIIFLGQRDDMYDFYNAMDLFILPSLYEGFGIVAIEAECNGLKTLLSDQVPKTAAITDNAEHLPLDLDTWCEKIHAIYKNGYERKDSSEIVRKAGFDMADNIKILEKIYAGEYK